jgi:glutaminase
MQVNPEQFAVTVCTIDGQFCSLGDAAVPFCVQSCSKPISYAIAEELLGTDRVRRHVGHEPSGLNFNELALDHNNLPHNPLINSGAIMTCALVRPEEPLSARFAYAMGIWSRLAGGAPIGFANAVYLSEKETANRNFCLAYMMREAGAFPPGADLRATLDLYFMFCSIEVTCEQLAVVAGTLANGGVCPTTGERVLQRETVRHCLSLMASCGMYDYSGEFAFTMGFPSKSGVAGTRRQGPHRAHRANRPINSRTRGRVDMCRGFDDCYS